MAERGRVGRFGCLNRRNRGWRACGQAGGLSQKREKVAAAAAAERSRLEGGGLRLLLLSWKKGGVRVQMDDLGGCHFFLFLSFALCSGLPGAVSFSHSAIARAGEWKGIEGEEIRKTRKDQEREDRGQGGGGCDGMGWDRRAWAWGGRDLNRNRPELRASRCVGWSLASVHCARRE